VLKLLGYDDVRMYDGSFGEWGNRRDTPIENERPGVGGAAPKKRAAKKKAPAKRVAKKPAPRAKRSGKKKPTQAKHKG
jgi:hypothetical protein